MTNAPQTPQIHVRDRREHPFFMIDNVLIDTYAKTIGPRGLLVYCALARYANQQSHRCYPSFRTLARVLGLGYATIDKTVRQLEALGLIKVTRKRDKAGDRAVNIYTLVTSPHVETSLEKPAVPAGGASQPEAPTSQLAAGVLPTEKHRASPREAPGASQPEAELDGSFEQEILNKTATDNGNIPAQKQKPKKCARDYCHRPQCPHWQQCVEHAECGICLADRALMAFGAEELARDAAARAGTNGH